MGVKLYGVVDGPPTLSVKLALHYLEVEYEYVEVDMPNGEHFSEEFRKKNPQGELPVLEDNGLVFGESVAILQYLADKYRKTDTFYPVEPEKRALINHRLIFNVSTFYKAVLDYAILPAAYAYKKTEANLKKLNNALKIFDEYLGQTNSNYVVSDNLTIADLSLACTLLCFEAMEMDISHYGRVKKWYDGFKSNNKSLWDQAGIPKGFEILKDFIQNPPDLSHLKHPLHPTDKKLLD